VLRQSLLEIGRRMSAAGAFIAPEDVLHLRLEEVESLGDPVKLPGSERQRWGAVVCGRAARRQELAGVALINPSSLRPVADRGDALVVGTPASAGRVSGPVAVVSGPADFGKLRTGDVLVCPYTNPSWTPLFQRAAAVVVDAGSAASHAAIVAREYGIPAVMSTLDGTQVLSEGQLVTVDGRTGRVTAAR
ncbi:MAG: PEP-utilizing enzyme, partial [Actinomycetes bacterium]